MQRRHSVRLLVALLLALPLGALTLAGLSPMEALSAAGEAFATGVARIGWVFVPQLALGVAVLGAALQRAVFFLAGMTGEAPAWIDPAIESALLLGMLGTLHGMVNGFVSLEPGDLQPGPLVQSLGSALRSSFVGFGIALVGVWLRATRLPEVAA